MICNKCGKELKDGAKFCNRCGSKMSYNEPSTSNTSTTDYTVVIPKPSDNQQWQQPFQMGTSPTYMPSPAQNQQPVTSPVQPTQHSQLPIHQIQLSYQPVQPQVYNPQVQSVQPSDPHNQAYPQAAQTARKKLPAWLLVMIIALPLLIGCGVGAYFLFFKDTDEPSVIVSPPVTDTSNVIEHVLPDVSYTYQGQKPQAVVEFDTVDSVFPSIYRSLESLLTFTGYSELGEIEVLIEAEVPGFTQPYKQKITLGRQITKIRIVPPLVAGSLDLNSEKMAQLVYSVTEVESGKLLVQESKSLKLYSKFDIIWGHEENWDAYTDNILAWMTTDAPEILDLQRNAIDYLSFITDGDLDALIGYQDYGYFDNKYNNTWVQAVAIQGALSDVTQVRYNMSPFSMDPEVQQRVKLPADTLKSRSGLCVETSLVMASALQSAGMHVMLIFPPGHCQVAVEAQPDSGDYFLIETTILPMAQDVDTWNHTVQYMTKEEWQGYITGEGEMSRGECYVLDCDLGSKLGIRPMSN